MERPAPLSFATIPRPAFGSARQHLDQPAPRTNTRVERRYQRAAKTAAELLPDLPQPGEAVHCLMIGRFDLCQVVKSCHREAPAGVAALADRDAVFQSKERHAGVVLAP